MMRHYNYYDKSSLVFFYLFFFWSSSTTNTTPLCVCWSFSIIPTTTATTTNRNSIGSSFQNNHDGIPTTRKSSSSLLFSAPTTTATTTNSDAVIRSSLLGDVTPLQLEDDKDGSFLAQMGVPTFLAPGNADDDSSFVSSTQKTKSAGLEGILNQGPALMVHNVLRPDICNQLIAEFEEIGFGTYCAGKNNHGALQLLVSAEICQTIAQQLAPHINVNEVEELRQEMESATTNTAAQQEEDVRFTMCGLNPRWRIYRYQAGGEETFAPHIDAGFPPSGLSDNGNLLWDASSTTTQKAAGEEIVSRLTVLMYLNDDFEGGETNFYRPMAQTYGDDDPKLIASVQPQTGSVLIFPQAIGEDAVDYARQHWPLHEGSPVLAAGSKRPKYVIRSDVLFHASRQPLPLDDPLAKYDHLVRETFQTRTSGNDVLGRNFLSHTLPLYNPHMGVENLGPLLYSLIRFTKVQKIVEIGAGYTSVWILQALKDNDDEMNRIQHLTQQGSNRLLDIDWNVDNSYSSKKSSLLCIDNCLHQKETASGAAAVAKSLGLDDYFEFQECDAYQLELEPNSVELLWCDFGVGSRMAEFAPSAWASIKPGGFLLCHSTLTNQGTRDWLEALRQQAGEEITGIPAGEYLELSLWEPHKRYQNSVSLIQKRSNTKTGDVFSEPIHSQYA